MTQITGISRARQALIRTGALRRTACTRPSCCGRHWIKGFGGDFSVPPERALAGGGGYAVRSGPAPPCTTWFNNVGAAILKEGGGSPGGLLWSRMRTVEPVERLKAFAELVFSKKRQNRCIIWASGTIGTIIRRWLLMLGG